MKITGVAIRNRLNKGFLANSFGFSVNLFAQILTVSILILYWGVGLYGEWLIVSAIPSYLSFANFGLGDAMATKMSMHVVNNQKKKALRLFQSSWRIVTFVSVVAALSLIIVVMLTPFGSVFNIRQINEFDLSIVVTLFAIYIILGLQSSLLMGAYRCEGNYPEHAFITNSIKLLESIIGLTFVVLGGGVVGLACIYVSIRVLGLVYLLLYLKNKSPWITISGGMFDISVVRKIIKPSLASISFSFGNVLINQGVVLIIGMFLGPIFVAMFSVYRTLSRVALKAIGIFNNIFLPEMTAACASNGKRTLRVLNRNLLRMSFQLLSIALFFLALFGEDIIYYWTLGKIEYDSTLFFFILLETLTYLLWYAGNVSITAMNKHARIVFWYLISNAASLVVMWFLLPIMGVVSAPISLAIGNMFVGLFAIGQSIKFTEDTMSRYVKSLFRSSFKKN